MLNRFKISTSLTIVLILFGLLQVGTVGVFFPILSHNKENFTHQQVASERRTALTESLISLLEARGEVNRAFLFQIINNNDSPGLRVAIAIAMAKARIKEAEKHWATYEAMPHADERLFQKIKRNYNAYHDALAELISYVDTSNIDAAKNLDVQEPQGNFTRGYYNIIARMNDVNQESVNNSHRSFKLAEWATVGVLTVLLLVMIMVWFGLRSILIFPLNKIIASIRHIAGGDLARNIDVHGTNEMGQLAGSLRSMQGELARTVSDIRNSADIICTGASEISVGNNDLSSRTEQQAASLEETASSMEELTATVKQNAENASQANQVALNASDTAQRGGKVVDGVIHTMSEIADSSQKIADITSVIDGIAFQTNILSLNAAVEAARAGEQGRGFAVVAGEVRILAQRSAQAAREIKTLIEDSVSKVSSGSKLVTNAGETMSEIVDAVTRVTDIMSEIAAASDEQSRGITQVGMAVTEMDRVTQQNASLVEESAAAAAALETQANSLIQAVAVFQIKRETDTITPEVKARVPSAVVPKTEP